MALNIKDSETIHLADELAALTGETKTRAVKTALEERETAACARPLAQRARAASGRSTRREIWPQVPLEVLGKAISREQARTMLGYGPEGV